MRMTIKARDFDLTDGLRKQVEHRLMFVLSQFQDRIRDVVVLLRDINGPRGGIDKHCNLQVRLNGLPDIVVEETEADAEMAVKRATDRARRTLRRRLLYAHLSKDQAL